MIPAPWSCFSENYISLFSKRNFDTYKSWARVAARCGIGALLCCAAGDILSAQTPAGNFGSVQVGTTSPAIPLTFTFGTSDTLASTSVLTQGSAGLDFADAGSDTCAANTAYIAGQTCTVNVTFTPKFAGIRLGAVVLTDSSGNTMATGSLQGVGTGPQVIFLPGMQNTLFDSLEPTSIAVDGNGDLFMSSDDSVIISEIVAVNGSVTASSNIEWIGSGLGTSLFLAEDAQGDLWVSDTRNNAVKEIPAVNGVISPSSITATISTAINDPSAIAVDTSGNVYVASLSATTITEILAVNGSIPSSPVTRQLGGGFSGPKGIAVDTNGNLYVADTGNGAIKEIAAGTGTVTTIGDGFSYPAGIALDGNGNLYVADTGDSELKEILSVNGSIPASPAINTLGNGFVEPFAVAVDGTENVYVGNWGLGWGQVVKLDLADPPTLAFAATSVGSISADSPQTIAVQNFGNAPLTFAVPSTGNDPSITSNFTLNSSGASACPLLQAGSQPATLTAGASCQLPISFAPTATGNLSGSLVLTDNTLNSTAPSYTQQSIALNGTTANEFTLSSSASSMSMPPG